MYSYKGRGAVSNRESRYAATVVEREPGAADASPVTECLPETVKTIISRNQSPDVPFEQSINPYRGCEHGCVYCYARPTHAWLDLSPGLDFETRLRYKHNAAAELERELRKPGYVCKPITIGANTDPYQPIEKEYRITRQLLEVLQRFRHPLAVITKGALIERDIDILAEMASDGLASVAVSVTTLDDELKRKLEPRAASARARLKCIEKLSAAGVPVSAGALPRGVGALLLARAGGAPAACTGTGGRFPGRALPGGELSRPPARPAARSTTERREAGGAASRG